MTKLSLASNLALPVDVVTEKLAWLGRTGSGKTYGAKKLAELMIDAGAQALVLDPVGVWTGLRLPGKGGKSFAVPVCGGLHGDVPITDQDGRRVAELVFERQLSAVIDVSQMIDAEQHRFATDFAERLFELHRAAPRAVHLFLEECQHFIPQERNDVPSKLLNRFSRLCMVGRNFGIGVSMISQRPQAVHKRCLNQAGMLFAFQLLAKHERKAVTDWFNDKGSDFDIDAELPKLKQGEPLVCSPDGEPKHVRILPIQSSDSSSTPKVGEFKRAVTLSPLDMKQLSADFAAAIEKAKADDPKTLRARIAELERQLKAGKAEPERVEVPVFDQKRAEQLRLDIVARVREDLYHCSSSLQAGAGGLVQAYANEVTRDPGVVARRRQPEPPGPTAPTGHRDPKPSNGSAPRAVAGIGKGELVILTAIAQHEDGVTREQLTVLTGYKRSSRDTYLQRLRQNGLIEDGETITVTAVGLKALGPSFQPLPTGDALLAHWLDKLPQGERVVLEAVVKTYPKALDRDKLSERTGYKRSSRDTYLQRLGARRLVIADRDGVRASEALFG